ncbi:MAG: hypothetical protein LBI01_00390 [Elusimicrobium sp.]|jgi:hypothetical protein|nr:hypothetical protein [Elusimicrobium sp.]
MKYIDYLIAIGLLAILLMMILYANTRRVVCPPQNTVVAAAPAAQIQMPRPVNSVRDAFNPEDGSGNVKDAIFDDTETAAANTANANTTTANTAAVNTANNEPQTAKSQNRPRRTVRRVVTSVDTTYEDTLPVETGASELADSGQSAAAATTVSAPAAVSVPQSSLTAASGVTTAASAEASAPDYMVYNNKRVAVSGHQVSLIDNEGRQEVLFDNLRNVCGCDSVSNDILFCKDAAGRVVQLNLRNKTLTRYNYSRSELCASREK